MDPALRIPRDLAGRLDFETRAELDGFLKGRRVDESMTAVELECDRQGLDWLGV